MSSSNWQKIEEVFDAAAELSKAEREAFLNEACGVDVELRREVEALLAADEQSNDFIESPIIASNTLASLLPDNIEDSAPPHFLGKRVGAYELVRELGRGGMGAVYLARRADAEFRKQVAVKLVKRGMDTDFILKRFRNERQILAHLDHPNVARLLDGGTTEEGLPYFVMEYVEGLPVHKFCDVHALSIGERLSLFRAICAAVGYAHQNQIIHRDLKPNNILVTKDGTPKLLDFGIAKILNPEFANDTLAPTLTGMRLMTPEYASPEQIRGDTLTTASDIYSLGVLLFEILTGQRPYNFTSHAPHEIARVICEDAPLRLSDSQKLNLKNGGSNGGKSAANIKLESRIFDDSICEDLENIILKSLNKSPLNRYATAEEFADDVQKYLDGLPVSALPIENTSDSFENSFVQTESLAVLPFRAFQIKKTDDSGDYLALGLTDSLITRLSRLKTISVRPTSSVLRYSAHDSFEPNEAGRELRVTHILDGRLQQVGNRVRLTAQLVKIANNETVWAGQFDEESEDILSLQDSISAQVAQALVKELTGEEREQIENRGTDNPKAYEAYLRGRVSWHGFTVENLAKALVAFYEAIALDPHFALPYSGVADYYNFLSVFGVMSPSESFPAAKEAASKAVELDDTSAEAYTSLGIVTLGYDWDFKLAEKYLKRALELNPNYAEAHVWYAHLLGTRGRHDLAIKEMRRAERLNPQSVSMLTSYAICLRNAGKYEEGLEKLRRSLVLQPNYPTALQAFSWFVAPLRNFDEAENACRKALEITGRQNISLYNYAYTLAIVGKTEEALEIVEELKTRRANQYVPCIYFAWIYSALNQADETFHWLELCIEERDFWMIWFTVDSRFNFLREDARYSKIAAQVKPIETEAEDDAIHQSRVPTKILPVEPDTSARAVKDTIEIPKKNRRALIYSVAGACACVLLIVVLFVGMRLGWGFAAKKSAGISPVAAPSNKNSAKAIAIFPFAPDETDQIEESLSVSMAQVLASKLGQVKELSVLPVSFAEKRGRVDADAVEVGRELAVNFVLRGALHKTGETIEVSAALLNVADGKVLWEEKFGERLSDLPNLQNTISERILRALTIEISTEQKRQIEKNYTTDSEAYQLYLAGRYQMTNRTAENLRQAIKTFSLARDKDPNFALAYAGLADAYSLLVLYDIPPPADAYPKAKENALKALTIDDTLAETHASLAYILFNYERNVPNSESNYRRAIELNPSYPRAYHWYALMLAAIGRPDEAIENIQKAQRLEPRSAIVHAAAAQIYFYAKNYDEAIKACRQSLEINEGFIPAHKTLRLIYEATGNYAEALSAYRNERIYSNNTDEKDPNWLMITAQVEAVGGNREKALQSLNAAIAAPYVRNNPNGYAYEIAVAYALLADKENAQKWLAIADKARAHSFAFTQVDPRFDKVR